jgi:hypothetical protein
MRFKRTVTAVALAALMSLQIPVVHAENAMGYRLLSTDQASRLPNKHGALGLDVGPYRQISDSGMTFQLMQVRRVQGGSAGAQAGFQRGDQIIAVNGRVFPSATAFAAYLRSLPPGSRVNVDYIPAGRDVRDAERVAFAMGSPSGGAPYTQAQEHQGMSTRTKIGLGAAAVIGCYYLGCFSGSSSR